MEGGQSQAREEGSGQGAVDGVGGDCSAVGKGQGQSAVRFKVQDQGSEAARRVGFGVNAA